MDRGYAWRRIPTRMLEAYALFLKARGSRHKDTRATAQAVVAPVSKR